MVLSWAMPLHTLEDLLHGPSPDYSGAIPPPIQPLAH
jgi:hypothetical protein